MKYLPQIRLNYMAKKSLLLALMLYITSAFQVQQLSGQCFYQGPLVIEDLSPEFILLEVDGALNDSLGIDGQGICGVNIHFTHSAVGDLVMQLISPEGQIVSLIGPTTASPPHTDFAVWNISFVPCNVTAVPDSGFMDRWQNNQNWSAFGNYSGSYYPYQGCFEDLNEGSVNGTWTLFIQDGLPNDEGELIGFSIVFCDPSGIDCQACEPDGGFITGLPIEVCQGDTIDVLPEPEYPDGPPPPEDDYFYKYLLVEGDSIVDVWDEGPIVAENPGEFRIYGMSLLLQDSTVLDSTIFDYSIGELIQALNQNIPTFCGSISLGFVNLTVNPAFYETLEIVQCEEFGFQFGDTTLTEEGTHLFSYQTIHGCDSIVEINLQFESVTAEISASDSLLNCHIPDAFLTGVGSDYPDGAEFSWWTEGGNISGYTDSSSVSVNASGLYFLEIGIGLCRDTAQYEIFGNPDGPVFSVVSTEIDCNSDFAVVTIPDSTHLISASWYNTTGFENIGFSIETDTQGWYFVEAMDQDSCVSVDSVLVETNFEQPSFDPDTIFGQCEGAPTELWHESFDSAWVVTWFFDEDTLEGNRPIVEDEGLYHAEIIGANGCLGSDSIYFAFLHPVPEVTFASAPLGCDEPNVLVIATTGISNSQYQWTGPGGFEAGIQQIDAPEPGRYDLVVTTPQGCIADTFFNVVSEGNLPEIEFSLSDSTGCISDSVQIISTSDFNGLVYTWSGPGGFESGESSPYVTEGGWYFADIVTPGSCELRDSVFVPNEIPIDDFAVYSDTLNCDNPVGYLWVDGPEGWTYQWSGPGLIDFTGDSVMFDQPGNYSVSVSDPAGECTASFDHVAMGNLDLPFAVFSADTISCLSLSAFIRIDSTDGVFVEINGPEVETVNDPLIEVGLPGMYEIVVMGENGCIDTFDIAVVADTLAPEVDFSPPVIGCGQDSVLLSFESVDEIVSQEWSGPGGFFSENEAVYVDTSGDYTLTVMGVNGCEETIEFEVEEDLSVPSISVNTPSPINCNQDEIELFIQNPLPGFAYQWTLPDGSEVTGDSTTTDQPGWHYVDVTDAAGCFGRDSVLVIVDFELPGVDISTDTITCSQSVAEVTVTGAPNDVYQWTGPQGFESDSNRIQSDIPGTYSLVVTGSNGCSLDTFAIVVDDTTGPEIEIVGDSMLTCDSPTSELNARITGNFSSVNWIFPDGTESDGSSIQVDQEGVYQLEVEDLNGCMSNDWMALTKDTLSPEFEVIADEINCTIDSATIQLDILSPFSVIRWPDEVSVDMTEMQGIVGSAGIYVVEVVGTNGCVTSQSVEVFENIEEPELEIVQTNEDCAAGTVTLIAVLDTSVAEIQWFDEGGFISSDDSLVVSGEGMVTVRAIGLNGCVTELDYEFDPEFDLPQISIQPPNGLNCNETEIRIIAEESDTGPDFKYFWTGPGIVSGTDSLELLVNQPGEYSLQITNNDNGCAATESVVVEQDIEEPEAVAVALTELDCAAREVELSAEGSSVGPQYRYEWSPVGSSGNIVSGQGNFTAIVNEPGLYILEVTNLENGCFANDTAVVTEREGGIDSITYNVIPVSCFGESDGGIEILEVDGGTPPFEYSFDGGSSFGSNPLSTGLSPGTYDLILRDVNGCEISEQMILEEPSELIVSLGNDRVVDFGEKVLLEAEVVTESAEIVSWSWEPVLDSSCPDCPTQEFTVESDIQLSVTGVDENGCTASGELSIAVNINRAVFLPNAFSPNGDGVNDFFGLYADADRVNRIVEFRVFDRWGEQVFFRQNISFQRELDSASAWDGRFNGEDASPGLYTWFVIVEFMDGGEEIFQGDVMLLR
jgi:gliding motility-associated-like protein